MAFTTSADMAQKAVAAGKSRTLLPPDKMILLGFLGGAYIAFGGLVAVMVGGGVNIEQVGVGIQTLVFAGVFPIGFILVTIGGAELFTGSCLFPPLAAFADEISWDRVWKSWGWVLLGNFIGSVCVAYFLTTATGLFDADPWQSSIIAIATQKADTASVGYIGWWHLFWRGIGCNWLVALALWMASSAENVIGKIFALWLPVMTFAAIGFEHSIANMFFIPAGMFAGANVNFIEFLFANLLPVTAGNIVGGVILVAWIYHYLYGKEEPS